MLPSAILCVLPPTYEVAPPVATPNITVVVGDKNEVHGSNEQDPTKNTTGSININDVKEPEQKDKKNEESNENKESEGGSILDFTKSFFVKKS